jgi:hypothetical protein
MWLEFLDSCNLKHLTPFTNLPEKEGSGAKPKQQRPELEPHELAAQLTKEQMGKFAKELSALAKRKAVASKT